jgi:hypothetical protein
MIGLGAARLEGRGDSGTDQLTALSRGPGAAGAVWLLFAANALAVLVTYARLPPAELYNTSEDGLAGGLGRTLVYLNYPVAIASVAVILVLWPRLSGRERLLGLIACVLCALVPWTVDQDDLDARWINVLPALGVAAAVALSLRVPLRAPRSLPGDPRRIALTVVLVVIAIPWLFAETGFYAPGPFLSDELSAQPVEGEESLAAVHLGSHHGTAGVLLALSALWLSRVRPLTGVASSALALLLAYGAANAGQDFWLEQVVKRGWTDRSLPSMIQPSLSLGWLGIVLAAVLIELLWFRRERAGYSSRGSS